MQMKNVIFSFKAECYNTALCEEVPLNIIIQKTLTRQTVFYSSELYKLKTTTEIWDLALLCAGLHNFPFLTTIYFIQYSRDIFLTPT